VILMVPAVAVALQGYSVLRILLVADLLCATAVIPALAGLSSRVSGQTALASALAGVAGAFAGAAWQQGSLAAVTFPDSVPTLGPFLGAILASGLVVLIGAAVNRERIDPAEAGAAVPQLKRG
jgi:sorbitol-specific phosphotransferase system component IIBC